MEKHNLIKLRTMCGYIDNEHHVWIPAYDCNTLFEGNIGDSLYRAVCINGQDDAFVNVRKIIKTENALYLFSPYNCSVSIYDINKASLDKWKFYHEKYTQISEILYDTNICWIIPVSFEHPILRIDLENRTVQELSLDIKNDNFTRGILTDDCILIANREKGNPIISQIFVEDGQNYNRIVKGINKVECFFADSHFVWILGLNCDDETKIFKVNIKDWEIVDIYNCKFEIRKDGNELDYIHMQKYEDKFILISSGEQPCRIIDFEKEYEHEIAENHKIERAKTVFESQIVGNELYMYVKNLNCVAKIDIEKELYSRIDLLGERGVDIINRKKFYSESKYELLEDYLEVVSEDM